MVRAVMVATLLAIVASCSGEEADAPIIVPSTTASATAAPPFASGETVGDDGPVRSWTATIAGGQVCATVEGDVSSCISVAATDPDRLEWSIGSSASTALVAVAPAGAESIELVTDEDGSRLELGVGELPDGRLAGAGAWEIAVDTLPGRLIALDAAGDEVAAVDLDLAGRR